MKRLLNSIDECIYRVEVVLLLPIFTLLPCVCFLQVLNRFVLKLTLPWTEEVVRILLVWAVFVGASLALRKRAHLGVTSIVMLMPKKIRNIVQSIINFFCVSVSFYIVYSGINVVIQQQQLNTMFSVTGWPTWVASAAIPLSFFLIGIRFILNTLSDLHIMDPIDAPQGSGTAE